MEVGGELVGVGCVWNGIYLFGFGQSWNMWNYLLVA